MKVGILLGPNGRGGMERQANLLAQGLLTHGIPTRVIFNSRPSWTRQGMDWASVPYQYLWRYKPLEKIAQHYLAWLLRRHRIDLLHVFYWGNMEFAVGAMKWARDVIFIGSQRNTDFVTDKEVKNRLKKSCGSYDHISCNSYATRELMVSFEICSPSKVKVIYNGVIVPEHTHLRIKDVDKHSMRTILFPNRYVSHKNPLLFIDACAEVCRRLGNIKVEFCGRGDLEDVMKERCREKGIMERCNFLGSLLPEEIPYHEADLVVNCSSFEGMSNSLMEALANGVPVVATKVAGSSELLSDRDFGRIIPINDKSALVTAMCDLLSISSEKRATLEKEAREYMARKFSLDHFVDEHISFYHEVLAERPNKMK